MIVPSDDRVIDHWAIREPVIKDRGNLYLESIVVSSLSDNNPMAA